MKNKLFAANDTKLFCTNYFVFAINFYNLLHYFIMSRLFGTNGVRGVTNKDMTVELALKLGKSIGTFFKGDIVIGADTRTSNEMLEDAVIAGLLSTGCNVFDAGMISSPALQYHVKESDKKGGVIITASHNPPEFNGIKVIDGDGTELGKEKEDKIEDIYFNEKWGAAEWNKIGNVYKIEATETYIDAVLSKVDVDAIKRKGFTVVLDCGNGAGCVAEPYILSKLGCRVITLNAHPDGTFPGRNAEPIKENVGELMNMVRECGADAGIAYDGDADRAIFIDERGEYVYGDKTLAIISAYMVERKGGKIVTPVSTSSCVEELVRKKGGEIVYTRVGSPIVARKMIEIDATFGGEENGGLIFPSHQYCRDGGMASAAILEIMALKDKKLSELAKEVPEYHLVKIKVKCDSKKKQEIMDAFIKNEDGNVDLTDGAKIYLKDAWVLVRPSGTEPIIRIYAEGKEIETARRLANEYKEKLERVIAELK
ncbi:MAG: phosphoglucosamine mutase [Candidatus Thermoplasmatota archaeon]|nr:phosphoglucosamine mutase [Candidatus Thermoplasmatota archaeon]